MRSRVHQIVLKDQKQFSRIDAFKHLAIQLSLLDVMESTKEGLMALAVQTGLRVIQVRLGDPWGPEGGCGESSGTQRRRP